MEGALELLPWPAQLGVVGFLIAVIITLVYRRERAISTGQLVPKDTHDRELLSERTRSEEWKELWKVADQRSDVIQSIASDMVVVGENMNKVLDALPVGTDQAGGAS